MEIVASKAFIGAMAGLSAVGTAVGAVSSIQQGNYQKAMYESQAQYAEIEAKQQSIQYEQQGLNALDESLKVVSQINARPRNLDPFSGSTGNLSIQALAGGYRDLTTSRRSSEIAVDSGRYQSALHIGAGRQAQLQGQIQAVEKIASTGMQLASMG